MFFNTVSRDDRNLKADIKRLFTVHEIIEDIATKKTFEDIATTILTKIERNMGYSAASLSLVDLNKGTIQLKYPSQSLLAKILKKVALNESAFRVLPLISENQTLTSLAAIENRVILDKDILKFIVPPIDEKVAKLVKLFSLDQAMAAVPIRSRNEVIGVLNFTVPRSIDNISKAEIKTLELFGSEIGIIIENILQYEEIKNFNAKLQYDIDSATLSLQQRNNSLQSIFNISLATNSSLDSNAIAQSAVDSIAKADGYIGAILSLIENEDSLRVSAFTMSSTTKKAVEMLGLNIHEVSINIRDKENQNLIGVKSFLENELLVASSLIDVTKGIISDTVAISIEKFLGSKAYVSVPINTQDRVIGVITYFLKHKTPDNIGEEDKYFMKTVAQVISTALHNSNLYSAKEEALAQLVKARQELEAQYEELNAIRSRERDMMDIMGHELRTPLSIIKISLGALDMKARKNPEEFNYDTYWPYSSKMHAAINRETELLETMLTSTKIDASRLELHLEKVELNEVINDAILGHKGEIEEKGIEVKYLTPENTFQVFADKIRLGEVIDNLVSNGIKYTEKGKVTISTAIEGEMVKVSIADTGIGIPKDALSRLGEKFYRVKQYVNGEDSSTTVVRPGGTGLGLYVTFGLIRMMNGEITVNSEPSKGSTFTFTIPLYKDQKESQAKNKGKDLFNRLGLKA